ncbi:RNA polymerase sigma factor [Intestinibacter sp.]|uniref:RNA polymerase sigma factor n=1 Tax=Intestinibacter sp. TaxID=1965304 RepID=UPI002A759B85|nr:sigma-70 family RNA polymerase sigma factor [Intestinibacter sp.]MDY2735573.1 sigma-70 family RNA polymerase sigma factor [Intestinibacter sp.]
MKEIEKLYDLYSNDVYRFIYSLSFDEEVSKDIMQSTFLECIKSIKNFKGKCSEKTWLLAIAKNQYYTYLKKHPFTENLYDSDLDKYKDYENEFLAEYNEVLKLINELKEPQRQIMILRLINDLTFKEIGEIIGKSESYCRVNFFREKKKIVLQFDK